MSVRHRQRTASTPSVNVSAMALARAYGTHWHRYRLTATAMAQDALHSRVTMLQAFPQIAPYHVNCPSPCVSCLSEVLAQLRPRRSSACGLSGCGTNLADTFDSVP
jgi:hypothetical protein